jgi:hypothetical protein
MVTAGNEIKRTAMNRDHYLSKRLGRQFQVPVDQADENEKGMADTLSTTPGADKKKQTSVVSVSKREAGTEPDIKSDTP